MQSENAVAGVLRLPTSPHPLLYCNSATQSAELTPIPHGWLSSSLSAREGLATELVEEVQSQGLYFHHLLINPICTQHAKCGKFTCGPV